MFTTNDGTPRLSTSSDSKPKYERPVIKVMSDEDVLRAFQISAAQIGAAATWWTPSC